MRQNELLEKGLRTNHSWQQVFGSQVISSETEVSSGHAWQVVSQADHQKAAVRSLCQIWCFNIVGGSCHYIKDLWQG